MAGAPSFPRTLNEKAVRTVAALVAVTAAVGLATGWDWLLIPLSYGFLARALAGPSFSPLAQLAVRVIAPRLGAPVTVAGPPKRFAQSIGAVTTVVGALGWALGSTVIPAVTLAMITVFATLEAVLGLCVGCQIFRLLMRVGVIPADVCAECSDIWSRPGVAR